MFNIPLSISSPFPESENVLDTPGKEKTTDGQKKYKSGIYKIEKEN